MQEPLNFCTDMKRTAPSTSGNAPTRKRAASAASR